MSLKAQVHLLAEKYGWTIEYVMKLTRKQVKSMLDGELELIEFREKHKQGDSSTVGKSSDTTTTGKGDSIYEIMSMPGMKISEKTKKMLMKIRNKKLKEKDARK